MRDSSERVTLRYTVGQFATLLAVFVAVFLGISLTVRALTGSGIDPTVVVMLVVVWMLVSWRSVGTRLTPWEVRSLGLTGRAVRWSDVTSVDEVRTGSSRSLEVRNRSGRTLRLLVPSTGLLVRDPDFEARADLVRAWWSRYRDEEPPAGGPAPTADDLYRSPPG
jgi:small-conductance mechanosensitive channel